MAKAHRRRLSAWARVLATAEAAKGMTVGTHGTTYGGNPLAMAVGNAAIDMVLAAGLSRTCQQSRQLSAPAAGRADGGHPGVFESVRGQGLMLGLKMKTAATAISSTRRAANGLIVLPAGDNVVRLLPPLTLSAKPKPAKASNSDEQDRLGSWKRRKAAAQ